MSKAFTKGEKVTVLSAWSRGDKGAVSFTVREATVHSCGAKSLKLIDDASGEMFGKDYAPRRSTVAEVEAFETNDFDCKYILPRLETAAALELAEGAARSLKAREVAELMKREDLKKKAEKVSAARTEALLYADAIAALMERLR